MQFAALMILAGAGAHALADDGHPLSDPPPVVDPELADEEALVVEIELESTTEFERNFNLDNAEDGDFAVGELEFAVGIEYETERFAAEIVVVLANEGVLKDETREEESITSLIIEEALVTFNDVVIDGFSIELGKLNFRDSRMWLYDRKLDAVKLEYEPNEQLKLTMAASKDGIDSDLFNNQETSGIRNFSLIGEYAVTESILVSGYVLQRKDPDEPEFRPLHVGLRSEGSLGGNRYWLVLGHLGGREDGLSLDGYAVDVGASRIFDGPLQPSLTLGYAWGSGDSSPGVGRDRTFRQTGLHKNESKSNSLARFKHYGEVFDPDLSNMHIFTAGIGLRRGDTSSLDFMFHNYRLDAFAEELRDAGVDGELDASFRSKNLGSEIDLVFTKLGFGRLQNLGFDFAIGYFWPGDAFSPETNDDAMFMRVGVAYAFGKDKEDLFRR